MDNNNEITLLSATCVECNSETIIAINKNKLNKYTEDLKNGNGPAIQDFFPELSADNRELFFISGICGECWKKIFKEDDED